MAGNPVAKNERIAPVQTHYQDEEATIHSTHLAAACSITLMPRQQNLFRGGMIRFHWLCWGFYLGDAGLLLATLS